MAGEMIGYCRICAQRNEDVVSVFGEYGKYLQLNIKLKICLQMTVMKDDRLPTTICLPCLTKLEACYQLYQLRLKGERKLNHCQTDTLDLSSKSHKTQGVMHGESRPLPIVMEEDMLDHPKRRKMRRHWNPQGNPPPTRSEPSAQHEQVCHCDTCQHRQYGALSLLADVVETQAQVRERVGGSSHFAPTVSGSSSYPNIQQVPSLSVPHQDHLSISEPPPWVDPPPPVRAERVPLEVAELQQEADGSDYRSHTSGTSSYTSLQVPQARPHPLDSVVPQFPQAQHIPQVPLVVQDAPIPVVPSLSQQSSEPPRHSHSPGPSKAVKKEVPCDFCGKCFTHTGDLNKHRRIHTGEKPYQCQQCDRKFSHASNLLRHTKIHSGERPFVCTLCGKGFSRKDKMLSHTKSGTCMKRSDSTSLSPGSPPSSVQ